VKLLRSWRRRVVSTISTPAKQKQNVLKARVPWAPTPLRTYTLAVRFLPFCYFNLLKYSAKCMQHCSFSFCKLLQVFGAFILFYFILFYFTCARGIISECDRQTDTHTDRHDNGIYRASIARLAVKIYTTVSCCSCMQRSRCCFRVSLKSTCFRSTEVQW